MPIDPRAVIDPTAKIAPNVEMGPFTVVGPNSEIASGCRIDSHVVIGQDTFIGPDVRIYPWASVGSDSQDKKFKGEKVYARIGARTVIREFVTINRGTGEGTQTVIGEDCLIMAYAHVAHNCRVGNHVILANVGTLAGHVEIEDGAVVGGLVAIHQFCRIGALSIIGGCSKVVQDVPPFSMTDGHPAIVRTINSVGLTRKGISQDLQNHIKKAFKILFRSGLTITHAIKKVEEEIPSSPEIHHLIEFIRKAERGICR
ncbi:MAG: acyl-ACP--UDP-N-acetylglucosamine O-acyltransferase [Chlamydiae bacterium]|nr:acyl-ACP--UDP-N-acetylglucosamine O-acyltransferase [Chlamydiota bacterium]MBI3277544.1 acyl-ACP--UDP-N-acetylglucosamine O-acyltransferase [Chlamydiota bacterium]